MASIATLKTKDLRDMAKAENIEGWEDMERKELIVTLARIRNDADASDQAHAAPSAVETPVEVAKPEADKPKGVTAEELRGFIIPGIVDEGHIPAHSKAYEMKRKLMAQPKVRMLIPLANGEAFGSTESVILNGYRLNIKKNVYVDVPLQVAEVISDSLNMEREAIYNAYTLNEQGVSQAMLKHGAMPGTTVLSR